MSNYLSFPEARFNAQETQYGRLYYEGSIPVIEYSTSDPYSMGYAQGMLVGRQLIDLYKGYMQPFIQALNAAPPSCYLGSDYTPSFPLWSEYVQPYLVYKLNLSQGKAREHLINRLPDLNIPEEYKTEMAGIADAVRDYHYDDQAQLTLDDLIQGHIFLDSYKKLGMAGQSAPFGCSAVALKKDGKTYFGRNLDWPDVNDFHIGEYTLLSRRMSAKGHSYISFDFPGLIGSLTAMNQKGLSLAICESGCSTAKGMPYNLLIRQLIEKTDSIAQMSQLLADTPCASSINLIAADVQEVALFQLNPQHLQKVQQVPVENDMVIATNHFMNIDSFSEVDSKTIADSTSLERYDNLKRMVRTELEQATSPVNAIKEGLSMSCECDTIQRIVMSPEDKQIQVSLGKEWAALRKHENQSLTSEQLF